MVGAEGKNFDFCPLDRRKMRLPSMFTKTDFKENCTVPPVINAFSSGEYDKYLSGINTIFYIYLGYIVIQKKN